jgi:hypothetical protein
MDQLQWKDHVFQRRSPGKKGWLLKYIPKLPGANRMKADRSSGRFHKAGDTTKK